MRTIHRLACMLLIVVLVFSSTGCGDQEYALKSGNYPVTKGMFSWFIITAYNEAYNVSDQTKNVFEQDIQDKNASLWIIDRAVMLTKEFIVTKQKFSEYGLSLAQQQQEEINKNVQDYWSSAGYFRYYKKMGVDKDSFVSVTTSAYKRELLLQHMRSELKEATPEQELRDYYNENYTLIKYIEMPYNGLEGTGSAISEKELQKIVQNYDFDTLYQSYQDRITAGESMDSIIDGIEQDSKLKSFGVGTSQKDGSNQILFCKTDQSLSEDLKNEVFSQQYGIPIYFDDTANLCQLIFVRYDASKKEEQYQANYETILQAVENQKFNEQITQWATALPMKENKQITRKTNWKELLA